MPDVPTAFSCMSGFSDGGCPFSGLAVISGLGGGIVRDVLLQHGPPVALTDFAYLIVALSGAAVILVTRPGTKGLRLLALWHGIHAPKIPFTKSHRA